MYYWKFNAGASGAFIDEMGKIAACDAEELIQLEYPGYEIIETIDSGNYIQCGCDEFVYRYTYKLYKASSRHSMYIEMDIGERTGHTVFNMFNERDYQLKKKGL